MLSKQLDTESSRLEAMPIAGPDRLATVRPEGEMRALAPGKPLAVILNSSGQDSATPGSEFCLSVTVRNQGNQSALIDIWIDPVSLSLQSWCAAPQTRLALSSQESEEVKFLFQVPIDVLPGTYRYTVVIDAQEHYPEATPIQFSQQIQVLPGTHSVVRTSDPTFVLQPRTHSEQPALLQPGGALPVQVLVQNRGDRVDRFRLVCTDLPKSWFSIAYPQGFQSLGLVVDTESLNLNPGEHGLISLLITPPLEALTGTYVPTLRLYSENHPDLVLLDLVYLHVPPAHLLQVELRTIVNRVRRQSALFQVRLHNAGNMPRELRLQVKSLDEDEICTYRLQPDTIALAPKAVASVGIEVQLEKGWKRPFSGAGRVLNFSVELDDTQQIPLPIDTLPGTIIWEARPWWQLLPLVIFAILGLGSIAYLIWWLGFRVPPSPSIVEFSPEDSVYSAASGDVVSLSWQINDPERLQTLKLVGLAADGAQLTRPEGYDFSQGIPAALQPFCTQQRSVLLCRNVRTSARKAGTYLFELTTLPKPGRGAKPDSRKTSPVTIAPLPQPKIIAFLSTQPVYQEPTPTRPLLKAEPAPAATPTKDDPNDGGIRLGWAIAQPSQLKALRLIGRSPDGVVVSPAKQYDFSQGIPIELQAVCKMQEQLICQNVNPNLKQPGDYLFELTAIGPGEPTDKPEMLKTDVIKILPKPPQIFEFNLNGQPARPTYLIPQPPGQAIPEITLSWLVDASAGSKVELLPAPGSVPGNGTMPIVLTPKPGSVTLTLQVTSPTGQQVTRSVTLETYDPTAADPAAAAAAAAGAIANAQKQDATAQASQAAAGQTAELLPVPNTPIPSNTGSLSPAELPPQFDPR